jgi:hypothetical protein
LKTFYISFEVCFPMQHVTTKLKNSCWLTKGIRISCKCKKSLCILSRNSNYPIIKVYIECCIILRKIMRNAKQTHHDHLLVSAGYKWKATWNIINSELGNANNNSHTLREFIFGNKNIHLGLAAEAFNKYCIVLYCIYLHSINLYKDVETVIITICNLHVV